MAWVLVAMVCTVGYTRCDPGLSSNFYRTEADCHRAAEVGQHEFNKNGKQIVAYKCVSFGTPV